MVAFAVTVATGTAWALCPQGFHHEKTRIFHASPKKRLLAGHKRVNGRTCLRFVKPVFAPRAGGSNIVVCPNGHTDERVGIFHDKPKKRLIKRGDFLRVKKDYYGQGSITDNLVGQTHYLRRICLAVVRPATNVGKIWSPEDKSQHKMPIVEGAAVVDGYLGKFRSFGSNPTNSASVCSRMCKKNRLCVAFTHRGNSCEQFHQYDYSQRAPNGDRVSPTYKPVLKLSLAPRPGTRTGLKVGGPHGLRGKVDFRALYHTKRTSTCPGKNQPELLRIHNWVPKALEAADAEAPVACLLHPRCVLKTRQKRKVGPATRYFKPPGVNKRNPKESCYHWPMKRRPRAASGGPG